MAITSEQFKEILAGPWRVSDLDQIDESLLLALAGSKPYFMVSYVFPDQVPDALKTPAMQLRVVQWMESFDAVQQDYDDFKADWYDGWDGEEEGPDWPEVNDALEGLNGTLGGLTPRVVLEAWVIGFSAETIQRDLGKTLEEYAEELHPDFPNYLEVLMALGAESLSIPERREMVETFIRDHGI